MTNTKKLFAALVTIPCLFIFTQVAHADEEVPPPEDTPMVVEISVVPTPEPSAPPTPPPTPVPTATPEPIDVIEFEPDMKLVRAICRLLYDSCCRRGDLYRKSQLVWLIYNRTCDESGTFDSSMFDCTTNKSEFWYNTEARITEENRNLAIDVLNRIEMEKLGYQEVGRTLPKGYVYLSANSDHKSYSFYRTSEFTDPWDGPRQNPYN